MEQKRVLNERQERILSVIPAGRRQALTAAQIMDKLAIPPHERRRLYQEIEELIYQHGLAIGSSSDDSTRGLFLIQDYEDLRLAQKTLESRLKRLKERSETIRRNFYQSNGGKRHEGANTGRIGESTPGP
jgi:hypothetical protein